MFVFDASKKQVNTRQQLHQQVDRFFYSCNIPFNVANHAEFCKMIEVLRPGYNPPRRRQLANELLDSVHESIQSQMKEELKGKEVTLMQDGWSDIHNSPVIASSLQCDGKAYFLNAETGSKNAPWCRKLPATCPRRSVLAWHDIRH